MDCIKPIVCNAIYIRQWLLNKMVQIGQSSFHFLPMEIKVGSFYLCG